MEGLARDPELVSRAGLTLQSAWVPMPCLVQGLRDAALPLEAGCPQSLAAAAWRVGCPVRLQAAARETQSFQNEGR